jgi:hypothetical protein
MDAVMEPTRIVTARSEPSGPSYVALLECGLRYASQLLLVVRSTVLLDSRGERILAELREHQVSAEARTEWPGTRLLRGSAKVHIFSLDDVVVGKLGGAAASLYEWRQPSLPEDLALLRPDDSPWLTTVSHEADAYLSLTPGELATLAADCPAVAAIFL